MIKVGSKLIVIDNSGAKLAKCIKLMGKQKITIGVIGGLLSLMVKLIKILGKISLVIIYKQKKKIEEDNSDNESILISEDLNNEIKENNE